MNVCHLDIDIYNPTAKNIEKKSTCTPEERNSFSALLAKTEMKDAFRFFHPDTKGQFTYCFHRDFNLGLRLDYFLASSSLFPTVKAISPVVNGTEQAIVKPEEAEKERRDTESETNATVVEYKVFPFTPLLVDSLILHKDTIGFGDHCPIMLILAI
jgi:hypothetical protein